MKIEWKLEKRKVEDLKDYFKNPRKISKAQIQQLSDSIAKFGLIDKPFINCDNTIIGGHQRVRLLKEQGYHEIEVYVPDRVLLPKEIEELNFRHNQNHGDWDFDILGNEYDISELIDWGADQAMLGIADEKQEKPKKPKVTFEFTDREHLEESICDLEKICSTLNAKMKIKV